MTLDANLISQFAKLVKTDKDTNKESIVYGKAIKDGDTTYVQIDGSEVWTPVSTSVVIKSEDKENGERVTVMVKDHAATIIGSTSSPSAKAEDVESQGKQIAEFDILVAYKVTTDDLSAVNAIIENLKAKNAEIGNLEAITAKIESLEARFIEGEKLTVDDMTAINAEIESLRATFAEITDLEVEDLDVVNAEIDNLVGITGNFTYLASEFLKVVNAEIESLNVNKLNANFANIDYANIDKANIYELYAQSGMIENIVSKDGTFSGTLVGVTIKGNIIEGGTIVAESLVLRGENGLYYELNTSGLTDDEGNPILETQQTDYNSINGRIIAANSITANKINVQDLVAFGATIAGFNIRDNALYSGVKETVDSPWSGIYLDKDGQFSIGDGNYFFRYYNEPICRRVEFDSESGTYSITDEELNESDISDITTGDRYVAKVLLGTSSEYDGEYYAYVDQDTTGGTVEPGYRQVFHPDASLYIVNPSTIIPITTITPTMTETGEEVLLGKDSSGSEVYYCIQANYKLAISAESILFGVGSQSSAEDLKELMKRIKMGTYTHDDGDTDTCIELSEGDSDFKQVITNTKTIFMDGAGEGTTIDKEGVDTKNVTVNGDFRHGDFVWAVHGSRGNYGLMWKGATE